MTRKITRAATRIKSGLQNELYLGNIDAQRDWGYASDYVDAMWRMLQREAPDDYVVATGEMYSVRDFLDRVFGMLDLQWADFVEVDSRYFRPAEVEALQGDATKARLALDWKPAVGIDELVRRMVEHDYLLAERELVVRDHELGRR